MNDQFRPDLRPHVVTDDAGKVRQVFHTDERSSLKEATRRCTLCGGTGRVAVLAPGDQEAERARAEPARPPRVGT
jgi:hypothetical protein